MVSNSAVCLVTASPVVAVPQVPGWGSTARPGRRGQVVPAGLTATAGDTVPAGPTVTARPGPGWPGRGWLVPGLTVPAWRRLEWPVTAGLVTAGPRAEPWMPGLAGRAAT